MSPRDERSVGEVLLEAEQLARRLLEDAPDRDGRAMARTWGESVETAADFWSAIAPQRQEAGGGIVKEQDGLLGQLAQSARGLQTAGRVSPGEEIRFDDEMTSIAENLARATELVSKYPQPLRPSRAQQADAQAARTQIVHTLYVSAHATTVALASNMRDHQEAHSGREYTDSGYGVAHLVDVQQRVAAAETMAGTWLQGRWPRDLPGVHRPSVDPQRLAMALSGWDIQANRALVSSPSAATLSFICQQEASLRSTARVVLGASAVTGHSDSSQFEAYARPALEGSQLGWARQARDWSLMSPRRSTALPPEPLQAAALELRAATREITHNDGTMATPDVVASRLDVGKAALNVQSHLASSVGIAHAVRQAGQDPDLAVFSQGAKQVMQREGLVSQQSLLVANVLQSNKTIRMPGELRVLMDSQGSRTLDLSKHAHSTTARLLTSTTSAPTETSGAKKPAVTAHERVMGLGRSKSVTSGPSR